MYRDRNSICLYARLGCWSAVMSQGRSLDNSPRTAEGKEIRDEAAGVKGRDGRTSAFVRDERSSHCSMKLRRVHNTDGG